MTQTNTGAEEAIRYLDPDDVVPDPDNPRAKLRDIDQMAASIAAWGVLEPITVRYVGNGKGSAQVVMVVRGHRRLAGAQKAKADGAERARRIPCRLAGDEAGDDAARAVTRLVENLQRDDFSAAEEARGIQQLLDLGLDAAGIAEELSVPRERVEGAARISASKAAAAVAEKHDLTFDQALVLAEFDGDRETIKVLTAAAVKEPDQWAHVVEQAREDRAEATALAAAAAEWVEKGYAVLEEKPSYSSATIRRLDRLAAPGSQKRLNSVDHAECPARAVWLDYLWHSKTVRAVEYCADWKGSGHVDGERLASSSQRSMGSGAARPEKSEKEREEDRIHRAAIKAGRAAQAVRREFAAGLLKRSTVPKGTLDFVVAGIIAEHSGMESREAPVYGELVGIATQSSYDAHSEVQAKYLAKVPKSRAVVVLLARVFAEAEYRWEPNTWRRGGDRRKAYLRFLMDNGYAPSLVEKVLLGQARPKAVLDEAERLKAAAKSDAAARPAPARPNPARATAAKRAAKVAKKRAPRRAAARS